jgi:hypothetical protein
MASEISKAQIDRFGERLKKGNITDEDPRLLDEYRLSFKDAYETVVKKVQHELLGSRRACESVMISWFVPALKTLQTIASQAAAA